ncbi:MAG: DedA family protein [Deltaproteobacteria bacterium]|nr:DedA family protein [Deltaproteobacteria bacterium]
MEDWLLIQDGVFLYFALFLMLMGGAVGLPIPEDLPLILAGIIAHNGNGEIHLLFIVCYVSILLGDLLIYSVGWKFGPSLHKHKWFKARLSPERLAKIRRNLEKRSVLMIFIARHLFYFRTVTFLTCGAVGMSFKRFILADAAAALVSVPLMMWLGYTGADQYAALTSSRKETNIISLLLVIVIVATLLYFYIKRRAGLETGEDSEVAAEK